MVICRLFVWFLAAAFIFGGSAVHASLMLPAVAQDNHVLMTAAPDAPRGHTAQHGHGADHAGAAADGHDYAQPHDVDGCDDDCLKCCSMCSVATTSAEGRGTPVPVAYGAVRFHIGQRNLLGHLVALDPDIPKTIV
jgi:hypothetical protein